MRRSRRPLPTLRYELLLTLRREGERGTPGLVTRIVTFAPSLDAAWWRANLHAEQFKDNRGGAWTWSIAVESIDETPVSAASLAGR